MHLLITLITIIVAAVIAIYVVGIIAAAFFGISFFRNRERPPGRKRNGRRF